MPSIDVVSPEAINSPFINFIEILKNHVDAISNIQNDNRTSHLGFYFFVTSFKIYKSYNEGVLS